MKKTMRRALGAALAFVMTAGLLSGCGGEADPIREAFDGKYTKDTVMMTVNGDNVTAGDLFFWIAQNADYISGYYSQMGVELDWSEDMGDGTTMGDYLKEQAKSSAVLYHVVREQAQDQGYEMTEEDKEAYQAELDSAKEQLGGDEEYANWLRTMLITDEGMEKLSSVGVLYTHLLEGTYLDGGEKAATGEEIVQYAEDNDLLVAKHILLSNKDSQTGEALSEEDAAAKKAKAEELLAQLQGITDPKELEAKFDELMEANSEDSGLQNNPDGYVFTAGQMVEEFENAVRGLEFGQVSGVVESTHGYHIILRLSPADSDQIREEWAKQQMDAQVQTWVDEAEVETTEDFNNLDVAEFYTALETYRDTIEPKEETP
ncbi:MAG: peptidylprolyl isomerase, partial [Bacillota bacterium]|nr:peptidylprolyl isomerase [Bacillota bacterium]